MVEEELQRIEQIFERGISLVHQGKHKQAFRLSKKLKNTWAVSEATRAQVIIEGYSLLTRCKPAKAKACCLESMGYLWDNPDGLFLIRQAHDPTSDKTKWFDIALRGGCAAFGMFTLFTNEHYARFLVLADDEFEASRYIEEISRFQEPSEMKIISSESEDLKLENDYDRKGVYRCSPFTTERVPERFLTSRPESEF